MTSAFFSELEALTARVVPSTARRTRICDGLTEFTFEPGRQMVMVGRVLGAEDGGGCCCVVACVDRVGGLGLNAGMDRMELGGGRAVDVWCRDYAGLHGTGRVMVSFTVMDGGSSMMELAEGALRHLVSRMTTLDLDD